MKKKLFTVLSVAALVTAVLLSCKKQAADEPVTGGYPPSSNPSGTTGSTATPGSGTSTSSTSTNFMRVDSVDMGFVTSNAGINTQGSTGSSISYYQIQGQTNNNGNNNQFYSVAVKFGQTTPPAQGTYSVTNAWPLPNSSFCYVELLDYYLQPAIGLYGVVKVDTINGSMGKRNATFYSIPCQNASFGIKKVSASLKTP
jgi:hypothetical protein